MTIDRGLRIEGAAENNLRDVDVELGSGITAVVGMSGSGKSSLVFDTLYHEARRRFLSTLSRGADSLTSGPAKVRSIHGLGPAVAVSQNVLNRNPLSTVATATGVHPYLRVIYARFAQRHCCDCGGRATLASLESQLARLLELVEKGDVAVRALLVRRARGTHRRLLAALAERYAPKDVELDGEPWRGDVPDPMAGHAIAVRVATVDSTASVSALRAVLESVAAMGCHQVAFDHRGGREVLSRAALCGHCGARLPEARPQDFTAGGGIADAYRLGGRTLTEFLALEVDVAIAELAECALGADAEAVVRQICARLRAVADLGLGYLRMDRSSPTLSRGEAQRLRLAVILAADVEDLWHVVDEPTIGLGPAQVRSVLEQLSRLAGPVVLVEHDRQAVAMADRVIELGPAAGPGGGRLTFAGTPAELWRADTVTGRWFSGRASAEPLDARPLGGGRLTVRGAAAHNLAGFDCSIPIGSLTVVTGPSGAGKSTFVRDVVVASLQAEEPRGCTALGGGPLRTITVDQSPVGRNPRSNPATYTGLADRIRDVFAAATGKPRSTFSFNRQEGSCPDCAGMGSIEVKLRFLPSEWVECAACGGRRFNAEVRDLSAELGDGARYTIGQIFDLTIAETAAPLAADAKAQRILGALCDVGLGYLRLGQPSPTLSGGEAQRVKLAKQLATAQSGQLVYLDEPTTGLHPANVPQLIEIFRSLVGRGCTVVVVEHNQDVISAADWVVELGPHGGPHGGQLQYAGPYRPTPAERPTPRDEERAGRPVHPAIQLTDASVNNLRKVSVSIPKQTLTAVVGISGSGKSSLIRDVLEAEATRRLLECMSMYERQSVREGARAEVGSVVGLGPTLAIGAHHRSEGPRSTIGTATELSRHIGVVLAYAGSRGCTACGGVQRRSDVTARSEWRCLECGEPGSGAEPDDFSPATYDAACLQCHGMGTASVPRIDRLIIRPDRPICDGALYSPGFYPRSYYAKPANAGYWMLLALGERYGFDPAHTPWQDMTDVARKAFLFGVEDVTLSPDAKTSPGRTVSWRGVFQIVGGWDVGGMYTERVPCSDCAGGRLRPQFLDIDFAGLNRHRFHSDPVREIRRALAEHELPPAAAPWAAWSRSVVLRRLEFLERVGLGYVHLDRLSVTLSAGEAQRVRLAALLGADLRGMVVLLDEPSRGLHPCEVTALGDTLLELTAAGNTVVLVDHDARLHQRASYQIVMGPGAGPQGGTVLAEGTPEQVREEPVARVLLDHPAPSRARVSRLTAATWMSVRKPTENNLCGDDVDIPLGVLAGVCGVSGSGKSTLAIDIVARALAPKKVTTSVANTPIDPGAHDRIDGAPGRVVHADQTATGIQTPGAFLGVLTALRAAYAESTEAAGQGLGADAFAPRCDGCKGRGVVRVDMGFMPSIEHACDACDGTGYPLETRRLRVRGLSLPELERQPLERVLELWGDLSVLRRPLSVAVRLGLGYLALGQGGRELSGGERQRLKLVKEMAKATVKPTLFILDEPTAGLHARDVARLVEAFDGLVKAGHSVLVVDHSPELLACCDWLVELGPGAGPDGGRVIAAGTPEDLVGGDTPIAPYLKEVLT